MNILVCGDSHTGVFRYCNKKQSKYNFNVCEVGGATALGLVNPNSKTNALPISADKIKKFNLYDKIILMLGEVDCGFVIWVRSKRYNISVDQQVHQSVINLFKFIDNEVIKKNNYTKSQIIVCGSVLPTIKDNANKKLLGGARSEVNENQYIRTQKTLEYNNLLKENCCKRGFNYIDITNDILDRKNGIVSNLYLNKNPYDHHLDNEKTYKLWLNELNKLFNI
jgi:hypothetical protein